LISGREQDHAQTNFPVRYTINVSAHFAPPRPLAHRQQMAIITSGLYDLHDLPLVHVTDRDYRCLRSLTRTERSATEETVLRFLARELDRVAVYLPTEIPSDAVTLRSRVIFRADLNQRLESRALVYGRIHSGIGGIVSILTPLGVALLGLRAGSRMPYRGLDGRLRTVSVERLAYQPETQERQLRPPYRYWPNPYADPDLRGGHPSRLDAGFAGPRRPAVPG
jgi:regulator of nucleoside diphosphate kinase